MAKCIAIFLLLLSCSLIAQTSAAPTAPPNNSELTQLYGEDQRVRQPKPLTPEEKISITRTDADRLALVKQMLSQDQLQSTADWRHAAVIVQHSVVSSDYLLAHTIALICAVEGDKTCVWLSAASLDRYLQSIQQPQIYGTQIITTNHSPATQQPYSPNLITDVMRKKLGVASLQDQNKQLDDLNAHVPTPSSATASKMETKSQTSRHR